MLEMEMKQAELVVDFGKTVLLNFNSLVRVRHQQREHIAELLRHFRVKCKKDSYIATDILLCMKLE